MKSYNDIVFDLDSTLVKIEGLDWLANRLGKLDSLAELTKLSMDGKISFKEAMKIKMSAMSPSVKDLQALGRAYSKSLVEDAKKVIQALQLSGKEVWILTGNFQPAVGIAAATLGIQEENIICNEIYFDSNGKYKGFNIKHPLSANGGKAIMLKKYLQNHKVVFIGDGYTDLEIQNDVDLFVGYGGVAERQYVKLNSKIYITCESTAPLLEIILSNEEKNILKNVGFKNLLKKAAWLRKSAVLVYKEIPFLRIASQMSRQSSGT